MTLNEIEIGTKLMLDEELLAECCEVRRKEAAGENDDFFVCSGDFGAQLYPTNLGIVIRNCSGYDRFGDMCHSYDFFIPSRDVLIHSDERFVIDAIGSATVTLRSLDRKNVKFWLSIFEFEQVAFVELDY